MEKKKAFQEIYKSDATHGGVRRGSNLGLPISNKDVPMSSALPNRQGRKHQLQQCGGLFQPPTNAIEYVLLHALM